MDRVEKVSIGGYAFTLEENAFAATEAYLSELEKFYGSRPEGKEIMEGILMTTKGVVDLYMHGTVESATPNVHGTFNTALESALCMQSDIYKSHSLVRKKDEEASQKAGYEILQDTNNSSTDFYESEIPTLRR